MLPVFLDPYYIFTKVAILTYRCYNVYKCIYTCKLNYGSDMYVIIRKHN